MCEQLESIKTPLQPTESPQRGECGQGDVFACVTKKEQSERLFELFNNGGKYSVVDIMMRLWIGDPRSVIRYLRKSGVEVLDEWRTAPSGNRDKVYWIEKG